MRASNILWLVNQRYLTHTHLIPVIHRVTLKAQVARRMDEPRKVN